MEISATSSSPDKKRQNTGPLAPKTPMTDSRTALITGITGQDGAYLARFLLERGYRVIGTSRDADMSTFGNLHRLGIHNRLQLVSMAMNDFRSVLQVLKQSEADEVYNLAGQSSVALSFEQPVETLESIAIGTVNLLEGIRFLGRDIRFYNAASSECFGDTGNERASESTAFRPRSPYAVAKSAAFWEVANYREAYGLFACSGILFNHESPLRPARFVTQKIVHAACRIAAGEQKLLRLGNLSVQRDWGWAEDYVDVMWRMLQQDHADDYVVATGETSRLEDFVEEAFRLVGLDWHEFVESDPSLLRPIDLSVGRANPAKVKKQLGWTATFKMREVVRGMVTAYQEGMEDG
jgi:GDPmannose 4,6-dehydratase